MATDHAKVVLIDDGGARSNDRLVDGLRQTESLAQAVDAVKVKFQSESARRKKTLNSQKVEPSSLLQGVKRVPKVPHEARLAPFVLFLAHRVLFVLVARACFLLCI